MINKNDYLLKYDDLYLRARYRDIISTSPNCPYPNIEIEINIEKNKLTGKFHTIEIGVTDSHWSYDDNFDTIDDAFEYFYNGHANSINFFLFQLVYVDPSKKNQYSKKLIEKLHQTRYDKIKNLEVDSFKKQLGIELKLIRTDEIDLKGILIIRLIKNQSTANEVKLFFVGKTGFEGNMIIIRDENDNMIYLTSSESITLETEIISEYNFWYFKKLKV